MSKNPTSFRLSDKALTNLNRIVEATGSSATAVIETALAQMSKTVQLPDTVVVRVGRYDGSGGSRNDGDRTHEVEFKARKIREHNTSDSRDNRGTDDTLYQTPDGRLLVHSVDWSNWQGESTSYDLIEISPEDLLPGGKFEWLGEGTEFGRRLTLEDALKS